MLRKSDSSNEATGLTTQDASYLENLKKEILAIRNECIILRSIFDTVYKELGKEFKKKPKFIAQLIEAESTLDASLSNIKNIANKIHQVITTNTLAPEPQLLAAHLNLRNAAINYKNKLIAAYKTTITKALTLDLISPMLNLFIQSIYQMLRIQKNTDLSKTLRAKVDALNMHQEKGIHEILETLIDLKEALTLFISQETIKQYSQRFANANMQLSKIIDFTSLLASQYLQNDHQGSYITLRSKIKNEYSDLFKIPETSAYANSFVKFQSSKNNNPQNAPTESPQFQCQKNNFN